MITDSSLMVIKNLMKLSHPVDISKFLMYDLLSETKTNLAIDKEQYFEIIWFTNKALESDNQIDKEQFIYLIPPFRSATVDVGNKSGYSISFVREYLEEDDKEYALDVFKLFNMQGQYSVVRINKEISTQLKSIYELLKYEYNSPHGTYLIIKSLLKVFILNLIRLNQHVFLIQDVNQKRVYELIVLIDEFYKTERKASFYSDRLGLGEKRMNQILKEKMNKSLTQLLHLRVIVEAKRKLVTSDQTIKEIAYELNFEDRGYFSRFFKKITGQSPEDFKKSAAPESK